MGLQSSQHSNMNWAPQHMDTRSEPAEPPSVLTAATATGGARLGFRASPSSRPTGLADSVASSRAQSPKPLSSASCSSSPAGHRPSARRISLRQPSHRDRTPASPSGVRARVRRRGRAATCPSGGGQHGGGALPVPERGADLLRAGPRHLRLGRRTQAPDRRTARHGSGRTRGRGPRDGIALCDPRTGEEYVDENTMIPQNSTVLVHRIAGRSTDAIQIARTPTDAIPALPIIIENDAVASNKPVTESMQKSGAFTGTDDEEITAIKTVTDAAKIKWGGSLSEGGYDGGQLGHNCGRTMEGEAPPSGYVCRMCCIPGHFIWQCPTRNKPPPPGYICHNCGVPGHFIYSCPNHGNRKFHSCPNYGNRKYDSRRTSSLIPIVSSFDDIIPAEMVQDMSSSVSDSLPAELHCPLCKKVMTDAMLSSKCCYDSFCDKCIRDYVITQSKCLCGVKILADDLIPNQTVRITISSLLSSRAGGLSSGTGNLASSNSSNLDGKSVITSAMLKGDTKQHMDSAPSASTEGNCLITACKNTVEISTHSDLQSKTEEAEKISVKNTEAVATETFPEPRCQILPQPDGVAIVSGKLERKVVMIKSEKKQKKAGATGNANSNCAEYGFNIPFEPPSYDSLFGLGRQPWGADPYMYCMPNMASLSYPLYPYNVNGISNLPVHGPGLQGYPANHYSEFQSSVLQDPEASAHARRYKRSKGAGRQSHKPECHRSHTSTQEGGSKRRGRSVPETTLDSCIESDAYYEEFHVRKKVGVHPTTSPRDGGQRRHAQDSGISELHDNNAEPGRKKARARSRRSQRSSPRHSYRRHAYEGSTSSEEERNFKRRW